MSITPLYTIAEINEGIAQAKKDLAAARKMLSYTRSRAGNQHQVQREKNRDTPNAPVKAGKGRRVSRVNYLVRFDDNYDSRLRFAIFNEFCCNPDKVLENDDSYCA